MRGISGNVRDVIKGNSLLHWQEVGEYSDACYHGIHKRPDDKHGVTWHFAMQSRKYRALDKSNLLDQLRAQVRKSHGLNSSQGGVFLSGDQMPVWLWKNAPLWAEEEHGTAEHIVCSDQFVDGADKIARAQDDFISLQGKRCRP